MTNRLNAAVKAFEGLMKEQEQQKLLSRIDEEELSDILTEISDLLFEAADLASEAADLLTDDDDNEEEVFFPYFIMEVHS